MKAIAQEESSIREREENREERHCRGVKHEETITIASAQVLLPCP